MSFALGGSWSPPACATTSPTSPASTSGGAATCCTAPTATAMRSVTSLSACSEARRNPSATRCLVRQWSDDVVFFANGTTLTAEQREQLDACAIAVLDDPVARLVVENDQLTGVVLESGQFVAAGRGVRPARIRTQ